MKVVDLNVLIYAVDDGSAHHAKVLPYWHRLLNGEESVALPWIVLVGFLRITTVSVSLTASGETIGTR